MELLNERYKVYMNNGSVSYILDTLTDKCFNEFKMINNDVYLIFENDIDKKKAKNVSICDLVNKKFMSNVYRIDYLHSTSKKMIHDSYDRIKINNNIICFYNIEMNNSKNNTIYDMSNGVLIDDVYTGYNKDNNYVHSINRRFALYDGNIGKDTYLDEITIKYTNIDEKMEYSDIHNTNVDTNYVFNYSEVIYKREDNNEYYKIPSNININKTYETTTLFDDDVIYKYFDVINKYYFKEPLEKIIFYKEEDYDVIKLYDRLVYIKDSEVIKVINDNDKELVLKNTRKAL